VAVNYTSDGTGTTGLAAIATNAADTLNVTGAVYRLASGSLSMGVLNLGNIRVGGTFSAGTLAVSNIAATDTFSDLLRFNSAATVGFGVSGGSATLEAGSATSLSVLFGGSTTTAGVKPGTLTVGYTSVGQAGTGLSDVGLTAGTVSLSGTVYRVAVGALAQGGTLLANNSTLQLAGIREGGTFATAAVDIRNTAVSTDGYSEKLNAVLAGTSGFGAGTGSVSLLAAGSSTSGALTLGLGTNPFLTAGVQTGTFTVAYQTDGVGTSELAAIEAGSQTLNLSGTVYRLATGTLNANALTLAAVREGGTFGSGTLSVSNASRGDDGYSEKLNVSLGSTSGDARITAGTLDRKSVV
jgi:hypothetical protein